MAINAVENLTFIKKRHPEIIEIANRLAELEQRKPHDSVRLLILEAGKNKIAQLEQESQEETTQINKN